MEISPTTVEITTVVEETRHVLTLTHDDLRSITAAMLHTTCLDAHGMTVYDDLWSRLSGYLHEAGIVFLDGVSYTVMRRPAGT